MGKKGVTILDGTMEILIREFGVDVVKEAFLRATKNVHGDHYERKYRTLFTRLEAQNATNIHVPE